MQLALEASNFMDRAISPFLELGAYEALWSGNVGTSVTFKSLAKKFESAPGSTPSDFVSADISKSYATEVHHRLTEAGIKNYGIRVQGAGEYPDRLRDADYPVALLYYQGWWDLVNSPRSVAVVGTRHPTADGLTRTRKLVRSLLADNFTIVSGLATGIDTEAHTTAIKEGGRTIAVIGTPLSQVYPQVNASLQKEIAENHLLISQVPVKRYESQKNPTANRFFFPERNVTMSALTDATIIVEAGETSGTLIQARAALKQGRKVFILDSCFLNPKLTWPQRFADMGAIRVSDYKDIHEQLIPKPIH